MFEISGDDITNLGDADLRDLVVKLAIAELRLKGYPRSSVTAGGNQDAADGGLDVRVECPSDITGSDFVPRRLTGFQVKKPDMPANAIREEMRPKDVLRDVIRELADSSGAYVIVSAQGSVADKPLAARRKAIRDTLNDLQNAAQLHTDFYDRDRLAIWVNEYPGISAWVRARIGRPLSGWSSIGNWEGGSASTPKPYLFNDKACLIDRRYRECEPLTITEGIARLRAGLRTPKQCIRLVGLSGLGKTRLVQALFEEAVGENPLDASLAIYTDYSEETDPTAREMARQLIAHRQRAILVVDNCNPDTHTELARLCTADASEVSLITVEYDVGDDELEHTDVFRLQPTSSELVTDWIKQSFPDISETDRDQIAEFSDGNFRVARALAETLTKGETLGSLKSRQLFERIFRQRNQPDNHLLHAAEDLSLLYSIDGEDVSVESELGRVGAINNIDVRLLYEALVEMRRRGVVQARGRFRAVLPQAIANRLAAQALDRISPPFFDQFCRRLTPRMLKSVSRRLGFLHDSSAAQAIVESWLRADGPVGDLMALDDEGYCIIVNIAPVAPEAVLEKLEAGFEGLQGHKWIGLIKSIGYEANLFDRAATLLARFAVSEPESNNLNSARQAFSEMFHIYLSGTQAAPEQRHALLKQFAASSEETLRNSVPIALTALLTSDSYMSSAGHEFGARSRDWGWHPKINQDIWDWFGDAIALAIELLPDADARVLVANNARALWQYPTCRNALANAATTFVQQRPWIEGWISLRAALRYDGKKMPADVRSKLKLLIERLKPSDILNQARAIVLDRMAGGGYDFSDGEDDGNDASKAWEKAEKLARKIGCVVAKDTEILAKFLSELLVEPYAPRAFQFGRGLADGADDLNVMWREVTGVYAAVESTKRNGTALGGFIFQANQRDRSFTAFVLEDAIDDSCLVQILPYLQAGAGLDADGIARLRRAIAKGTLTAINFHSIANGSILDSPPETLAELLEDIATLPYGVEMALDILGMYYSRDRDRNARLFEVGRNLLVNANLRKDSPLRDYGAHVVIRAVFAGEDGRHAAKKMCANIRSALCEYDVSSHNLSFTLGALFEIQPFVALDAFVLPSPTGLDRYYFDTDIGQKRPIEHVDPVILKEWAKCDPEIRYPLIAERLSMFERDRIEGENNISSIFLSLLDDAPDKELFIGDIWHRLQPRSWSGSLADILINRKAQLMTLKEHSNEKVRAWVDKNIPEIDLWIEREKEQERQRERKYEESFE